MDRPKIRTAHIESARRALEQAPEQSIDQVTKRDAIRALAETISAAQKKGYSLEAVAELLTANGIAVSRVLLASYLSHSGRASGKQRKKRRSREGTPSEAAADVGAKVPSMPERAFQGPLESGPIASPKDEMLSPAQPVERACEESRTGRDEQAPGAAVTGTSSAASAPEAATKARSPGEAVSKRKSEFVPRKDSDDI